jgi:hypothetical protein
MMGGDRAVAGIRAAAQAGWLPYVASDDTDMTVALARENGAGFRIMELLPEMLAAFGIF